MRRSFASIVSIVVLIAAIITVVAFDTGDKTSNTSNITWGKMPLPHGTTAGTINFNGAYGKLYLYFWNGRNQWVNRDSVHRYYLWHTMPASRIASNVFTLNDAKRFTLQPNGDTVSTFKADADGVASNELRYAYSGKHPTFSHKVWTWTSGPDIFWDLLVGRPANGPGSDSAYTWVAGTRYDVASDTLYWTFVPMLNQP